MSSNYKAEQSQGTKVVLSWGGGDPWLAQLSPGPLSPPSACTQAEPVLSPSPVSYWETLRAMSSEDEDVERPTLRDRQPQK